MASVVHVYSHYIKYLKIPWQETVTVNWGILV